MVCVSLFFVAGICASTFAHLLTGAPVAGAVATLHIPFGSAAVVTGGFVHAGARGDGARNLAAHWQSCAVALAIPNEIAICPAGAFAAAAPPEAPPAATPMQAEFV